MSASPINAVRLIPATITSGKATGLTTSKVLVDPATGLHYCADCEYTAPTFASARSHRVTHSTKSRKQRKDARVKRGTPDLAARIDQIGALLDEVRAEFVDISDAKVDASWKARATAAERRLATLRRALGGAA
jgi:hypothetical protein